MVYFIEALVKAIEDLMFARRRHTRESGEYEEDNFEAERCQARKA